MNNRDKYKNSYNFEEFLGDYNSPYDIYDRLPGKDKLRLDQQRYSRNNEDANMARRNFGQEPDTISRKTPDFQRQLGMGEIRVLQELLNQATGIYDNAEVDISPSSTFNMPGSFEKAPYFTMEGALTPAPQMGELEKLMQLYRQEKR